MGPTLSLCLPIHDSPGLTWIGRCGRRIAVGPLLSLAILLVITPPVRAYTPVDSLFATPAPPTLADPNGPSTIVATDLDGDGHVDLVVSNVNAATVSVFLGQGDGTFGSRTDYAAGGPAYSVAQADLNRDGKTDVLVVHQGGSSFSVLPGGGDGSFGAPATYPAGGSPTFAVLGDLNGDGNADAVIHEGYTYEIYLGNGDGTFQTPMQFTDSGGGDPALADVNGDNKLDLAVGGNAGAYSISVRLGNGDGTFGTATSLATGRFPLVVAVADVNDDSKPDLVVPVVGDGIVSVFLGKGDGTFRARRDFPTAGAPVFPLLGDFRGSGNLDLITVNQGSSNSISFLEGNGDGTFGLHADYPVGPYPGMAVAPDFNEDGRADVAVSSINGGYVSLLINAGLERGYPRSGLLAHWLMDGDAADAGGQYGGTISGATATADRHGTPGTALHFDGSDYVEIPNTQSNNLLTGFSIAAWVQLTAANHDKAIFSKHVNGTGNGFALGVGDLGGSGSDDHFSLYLCCGTPRLVAPAGYGDGRWHRVVATYDVVTQNLYVDGQRVNSAAGSYTTTNTTNWRIGAASDVVYSGFQGNLDDVRLYDRTLSPAEVAALGGPLAMITASAGAGGTISPVGDVIVDVGSDQTFTITPDSCHTIADVLVDGSSVGAVPSYTFTDVTADHTIAASFALKTYTITASAGSGGTITPAGAVSVACAGSQVFAITATAGYAVSDVLVDGVSVGAVRSYTFANVTTNRTISVTFRLGDSFFSDLDALPSGIYTTEQGQYWTVAPSGGGQARIYKPAGGSTGCCNAAWFGLRAQLTGDFDIRVKFRLDYYATSDQAQINLHDGSSGSFLLDVERGAVETAYPGDYFVWSGSSSCGRTPSSDATGWLRATRSGSNITGWRRAADGSWTAICTRSISSSSMKFYCIGQNNGGNPAMDVSYDSLSVTAGDIVCDPGVGNTITASAGFGGSISPSGVTTVFPTTDQTYAITPSSGYSLADVKVDGVSVGAVSSYTFTNVTAAHTISATFNSGAVYFSDLDSLPSGTLATWAPSPWSVTATEGRVRIRKLSDGPVDYAGFRPRFQCSGDFDIQVKYRLDSFASGDQALLSLRIGAWETGTWTLNAGRDAAIYLPYPGSYCASWPGYCCAKVSTSDMSGWLRVSRSGSIVTAWGRSPSGSWVAVDSRDLGTSPMSLGVVGQSFTVGSRMDASYDSLSVAAAGFIWDSGTSATIIASAGLGGSINPSGTVSVTPGTDQAFTITPDSCHTIADVLVDGASAGAVTSYTFTNVAADHTISASFALKTYTITASVAPHGSIFPAGGVSVGCAGSQTFTITPVGGYAVKDLLVDGASVGALTSYTFTNVTANHTIAATFGQLFFDDFNDSLSVATYIKSTGLNWTLSSGGGAVHIATPGGGACCYGTWFAPRAQLTGDFDVQVKYRLDQFADGDQAALELYRGPSLEGSMLWAVLRDATVIPHPGCYGVYTPAGGWCNATPSADTSGWLRVTRSGTDVTGWRRGPGGSWMAVCTLPLDSSPIRVGCVGDNYGVASAMDVRHDSLRVVADSIAWDALTITASAGAGGSIVPSGSVVVAPGGSQTFTITPDSCHTIADVLVDGASMGAVSAYTFTDVTANHAIAASFAVRQFTITASAGSGGMIIPAGAVSVDCAGSQTFTITPVPGYAVSTVLVDGASVGPVASYTFTNVTANRTIAATFAGQTADLVVSGPMTITSDTTFDNVTVQNGGTLTVQGLLAVTQDMTVQSGGVVTHGVRDTAGLRLSVTGTLTVAAGGAIDVSGKGLLGGSGGGNVPGETFDASGAIVAGAAGSSYWCGSGGSYGGSGVSTSGGPTNSAYGWLEDPRQVGSGGGGSDYAGGNGGGRVRMVAGALVLNGVVRANGGAPIRSAGGGSGGGIRVEVGSLSGSGQMWASGGNGPSNCGGAGGGGRIAIYYDVMTLPEGNVVAAGGSGGGLPQSGGAGTVYLKDRAQPSGRLILDNAGILSSLSTPIMTSLALLGDVILRNGVQNTLDITRRVTSWTQVITLESSTLSATDSIRLEGTTLRGTGTVATKLINAGEVSPGTAAAPIGQIVCASGYEQREGGILRAELAGASAGQFDHLHVVGDAALGGQLRYAYLDDYLPPEGTRFPILSYGTRNGTFSSVAGGDTATAVSYLDSTVTLVAGDLGTDHTPPNTFFTAGLADSGWTNATSATFGWSGTDNASPPSALRYSYRLDSSAWSALGFATSAAFDSLTAGQHTVQVYAVDEAGNADATPAQHVFTVDLVAPTVAYVAGPAEGDTVGTSSVSFTVRGADDRAPASSLTYSRSLDGAGYTSPAPDTVIALSGLADGTHTLNVRAHDPAGNIGTPVARTWRVAATAPTIAIVSGPAEGQHQDSTTTSFSWSATSISTPVGDILYRYALDATPSGAWSRDTSSSFAGLAVGVHTLNIEAQDRFGHVGTLARHFRVDLTPPQTSIASGPADGGWANSASATFGFTGTDDASATNELRYAWRVDSGAWSALSTQTSAAATGLTEGLHVFEVYAVDKAGNADPTPAARSFTVDLTLPTVAITQGPAEGDTLPVSAVTFAWAGADDRTPIGLLKFSRSLDGAGYTSPSADTTVTLTSLADGLHTLAVRSHDLAGNPSAPVVRTWRVAATAPTIAVLLGPAQNAHLNVTDTSFTWTATSSNTPVGEIVYRYAMDAAPSGTWARDTVATFHGLAVGLHTLNLEAQDRWGHLGTLARSFRVDLTPPQTSIASGPAEGGWTNSASATFGFTGTDDASATNELRYAWRVDTTAWSALSTQTSATATGLAEGAHVFEVYAADKAGNVDPTPAARSFTVDLTPPETELLTGPAVGETLEVAQATFGWAGSDDRTALNQLTYAYRLDGGGWSAYGTATATTLTSLADGSHTFEVRARDLAGNADPTPAARAFWCDTHGPVVAVVAGLAAGACLDSSEVSFAWTGSDVVTRVDLIEYRYRLDGGAWSAFGRDTVASFSGLAEGSHTLSLEARDLVANVGTLSRSFVLDRTDPVADAPTLRILDGSVVRVQCTAGDNIGISGFRVQIATDTSFASLVLDANIGAAGIASASGSPGHTYWARVHAVDCAGSQSAWSAISNEGSIDHLPDLAVPAVQAPASALSGLPILVSWTVADSGLGGTNMPQWYDDVYLTTTPSTNLSGAIWLGRQGNLTALAAGESYLSNCQVTIPRGAVGTYYVVVVADNTNLVPEVNAANNARVSAAIQVRLSDYPDLVVPVATVSPTAYSGDSVLVTWTVRNQGQGRTDVDRWWDTVFLSADSLFDYMSPDPQTITVLDLPLAQRQHVGALEADSSYAASMRVRLPDGIHGDYYVFVASDMNATYAGQHLSLPGDVFENTAELNLSPACVVEITLTPPANLVVDAATAPDSVWSGTALQVTWQVTNRGYNPTHVGSWTDRVYFSADSVLDGADLQMGSFGHSGVLGLEEGYAGQATLSVPLTMSGPYYVFVRTDVNGQVYESDETDNARSAPAPVVVRLSPWPDLQVSAAAETLTASAGTSVPVSWGVVNAGADTAWGSWVDKVYVSRDSNGTGLQELASAANPGGLEPGADYVRDISMYLPTDLAGAYYVFVGTDANNSVFEHTDEGNNTQRIGTLMVRWPDLQVSGGTVAATGRAGESVRAGWSVVNAGLGTAAGRSWYDKVYVSRDSTGSGLQELGSAPNPSGLAPGAEYASETWVYLPTDLAGTYYVYVTADANGGVYEYTDEGNNRLRIGTLLVQWPDLRVSGGTGTTTGQAGQSVAMSWSVVNAGSGTAAGRTWTDRLYVSRDSNGTNLRELASTTNPSGLGPGAEYTKEVSLYLPTDLGGSYYVYVTADAGNAVFEHTDEGNNTQRIGTLLVQWPDLQVSGGAVVAMGQAGQVVPLSWSVRNAGLGTAAGRSWYDKVSVTPDSTGANLRELAAAANPAGLAPGAEYAKQLSLNLPTDLAGTYYVYVTADANGNVYEHTAEDNNRLRIGSIAVTAYPPADVAVTAVSAPDTAWSGQALAVSWSVQNMGTGTTLATSWGENVYLSADTLVDAGDYRLATLTHGGALAPGATYNAQATGTIPNGMSGTYYAIVREEVTDANAVNNLRASAPPVAIQLTPAPDLAFTVFTCDAEGTAGQPLTARWTVANQGPGVTVPAHWGTALYLSTDAVLEGSDLLLGTAARTSALAPGQAASESLSVTLPGWASGPFYLFAKVDNSSEVYEASGESNNTGRTSFLVYLPPPADLVVRDVTVPLTAIPGEPVTVEWTLANEGTNAVSGQVYNAVYVSADTSWEVTDPLLTVQSMYVSLPAGGAQRFAQRVSLEQAYRADAVGNITATLPGVPPGAYYGVVRTNVRNTLRELTTANNVGVSALPAQVEVALLTIGVPASGTLTTGQSRYYRVETPADQDLTVSLTSDVADATNELYASYGTTPTASSYGYAGPPEFTSHPSLLIAGTQAEAYYVLVTARGLPPGVTSETFTVRADALPFSLTSVTPARGGRAGRVTTTVSGAGLRTWTRLTLVSGSDTVAVPVSVSWVNSMELQARWRLDSAPAGTYDLVAMTGDSVATLPASFTVEEATALEVVTTAVKPDVIRRTGTTAFTFRYRNAGNRDVGVLKARLLFPAASTLVNLGVEGGLKRRSDLYPELYAPVSGDVYVMADTNGTCSYPLAVLDLVGVNLAPEEEWSVTLNLRGFEHNPYSVRSLTEVLEAFDYVRRELNVIEEARTAFLAAPAGVPAAVVSLAASREAFADTAVAYGYVARGLVTAADVADYRVVTGGLQGGVTDEPVAPVELLAELAGSDTCAIPAQLPECRPNDAPLTTALPGGLSCVADTVAVPLALPEALTVRLVQGSCEGYGRTVVADARVVLPCDPNLMTGPMGFGAERWVGVAAPLSYRVDFENLSEVSSAPAQVVRVEVPIDAGLDASTFRLGSMGFGGPPEEGGHVITVPPNLTTYTTEPYYADLGLKVRVTAGIDIVARAAVWTFTSIDPATNAPPTNPLVGFLPVNDPYGHGQGFANYTIRPLGSSPNGTEVQAQAAITFDVNTPIATNSSSNRLDNRAPASHVLPAVEMLDTTLVRVRWTGADGDSGAGLKSVSLYGRTYGGVFQLMAADLTGDSLTLALPWGYEYQFYTRATDHSGNVEGAKTVAEGSVAFGPLAVDTVRQVPLRFALYPSAPNPFHASTVLRFELPVAVEASLEVFDVAGRRVAEPLKPKRLVAGRHSVTFRPERLQSGMYFCRLKAGRFEQTIKVVLVR
jgi:hypothetical protein